MLKPLFHGCPLGRPFLIRDPHERLGHPKIERAIADADAAPPYLHVSREAIQFNHASEHTLDVATFIALLDTCDAHPHQRLERRLRT